MREGVLEFVRTLLANPTRRWLLIGGAAVVLLGGAFGGYATLHHTSTHLALGSSPSPGASPTDQTSADVSPSGLPMPSPSPSQTTQPQTQTSPNTVPHCTSNQVALTLATDKSTYTSGALVYFLYTLTNTSNITCDVDETNLQVPIYDASGNAVMTHPPGVYPHPPSPYSGPFRTVLGPGQKVDDNDCSWDTSYGGTGHSAYSGRYHARVDWQYPVKSSGYAYFSITGGPSPTPGTPNPLPTLP